MAITSKRICVTGGAGFIGSHLVSRLVEHNEVVVFDNLHRNALQFAHLEGHPRLRFIKGDPPSFDELMATMTKRARGMNVDKIKTEDLARSGGASDDE